jgi:hypothetical protein
VKGLVDGGLGIEREASVNLSGDLAGDDLEDLLAELDKETVQSGVNLLIDGLALLSNNYQQLPWEIRESESSETGNRTCCLP